MPNWRSWGPLGTAQRPTRSLILQFDGQRQAGIDMQRDFGTGDDLGSEARTRLDDVAQAQMALAHLGQRGEDQAQFLFGGCEGTLGGGLGRRHALADRVVGRACGLPQDPKRCHVTGAGSVRSVARNRYVEVWFRVLFDEDANAVGLVRDHDLRAPVVGNVGKSHLATGVREKDLAMDLAAVGTRLALGRRIRCDQRRRIRCDQQDDGDPRRGCGREHP